MRGCANRSEVKAVVAAAAELENVAGDATDVTVDVEARSQRQRIGAAAEYDRGAADDGSGIEHADPGYVDENAVLTAADAAEIGNAAAKRQRRVEINAGLASRDRSAAEIGNAAQEGRQLGRPAANNLPADNDAVRVRQIAPLLVTPPEK